MRTSCLAATALVLLGSFSMSCGGGGGKTEEGGGLTGFSTGTPQAGSVPSDGSSPAAPVVAGVVVTSATVGTGDLLHVNVSFADPQGDIATVNIGIAGQSTYSSISVASVGAQPSGTLFLDLKPASYSPGTYILIVSITDLAGHTSVAATATFTILGPGGIVPPAGLDAGATVSTPDAARVSDGPVAPDLGSPDLGKDLANPMLPEAGPEVAVTDLRPADLPPVTDGSSPGDGGCTLVPGSVINSTTTGGLWHDATTWVCGVVPTATDDVQINAEVQVNLSAAQAVATCRNLTVAAAGVLRGAAYTAAKIQVTGDFINLGNVRNGPPYASYDDATLQVYIGGNFTQNNVYGGVTTHFAGAATQTITYGAGIKMAGTFIDDSPLSSLKAGSAITADATTLTLGTADTGRSTLDMGAFTLTLSSGDFKIAYGILVATKIVGVAGATLSADQIKAAAGTLTLEGDIRTGTTSITGSVVVAANTAFYNQSYVDAIVTITGGLTNNGIVRWGPGYAAYGENTMTLNIGGDFAQNGDYTVTATTFNGTTAQTITLLAGKTLTGKFSDATVSTPLQAGSDLNITEAEFVLPADGISTGALRMGSYKINHPSGTLKIATGTLEANDLTGDTAGAAVFNVANITPPSGTLTVHNHFRTGSVKITGNLALAAGARMYNQVYVQAYVTVTGNVTSDATALYGSGPGYASYDDGALYVNGTKMAAW
jgi:hypothetical protein